MDMQLALDSKSSVEVMKCCPEGKILDFLTLPWVWANDTRSSLACGH